MSYKATASIFLFLLIPCVVLTLGDIATVTDLVVQVEKLPTNRALLTNGIGLPVAAKYKLFSDATLFLSEIESWMNMRAAKMKKQELWQISNAAQTIPEDSFFDCSQSILFTPFVEKVLIDSAQSFLIRGDLHGDIHSLVAQLKDMKSKGLIDDNFKLKKGINLAFLGDFVDRGNYGTEVLFVIARLGNMNPDNVFYTRGNHEDINICSYYGFKDEIINKFSKDTIYQTVCRMYDFMPTAIYLGDTKGTYIQLCHGGIEPGYNPKKLLESDKKYQLIGILNRQDGIDAILVRENVSIFLKTNIANIYSRMFNGIILQAPAANYLPFGHMWNDFDPTGKDLARFAIINGRGIECGQEVVNHILENQSSFRAKIIGIIRAHQHSTNPFDQMMKNLKQQRGCWNMRGLDCEKGLGNATDKDVVTLNVSPDSIYGQKIGFDDDLAIEIRPNPLLIGWSVKKHKYYPLANKKNINFFDQQPKAKR
jgi:hypothetical protein